jgi:hypothetical protein
MPNARRSFTALAAALLSLVWVSAARAEEAPLLDKVLETRYAAIRYANDSDIAEFLWRITGHRLEFGASSALTVNRVDEMVERVESLLELYPSELRVEIRILPKHKEGPPGFYSHQTKNITVFLDTLTDGMLAHELAHAVISASFDVPPPQKAQEILAQYVDQHLWSEL